MRLSSSSASVCAAGRNLSGPVPSPAAVDPSTLRDIAERILTPRQYEIWRLHIKEWEAMRIAQFLRVSLRTVRYELAAIKVACREADIDRKEGAVRLYIETASDANGYSRDGGGTNPACKADTIVMEAHRRLSREVFRHLRGKV